MRVIPPVDIVPATFTRASTGTYLDVDGVQQTAAVDVPRFGYGYAPEPEGGPLVNLIPYSENFAPWVASTASVVPNAIASPYPGKPAAKIVEIASAITTHYIFLTSGNVVVGQQVTLWAVVKPAERFWFMVRFLAGSAFPTTRFSYINAQTLAVQNGTGSVGSATPLSDGFVLVSITATAEVTGVVLPSIFLAADPANNSYAGDGVSGAYIARAQVNYGPVPQDYIETNGEAGYTPPAWQFKGLLQEAAATNLCLRSQDLTNAVWLGTCTATVSAKTWHGVPFYALAKTSASSSESENQQVAYAVAAGGKVTVTLALLAETADAVSFGLYHSTAAWGTLSADFEVLEGPGVPLPSTSGLLPVTNLSSEHPTVVRLTRTFVDAVPHVTLLIYPGLSTSTTIGHSILVTRVQVVAGEGNGGSYIPTTSAAVTRAADVMGTGMISSIPEPDIWTGETEWNAGTSYILAQRVSRSDTHRVYERLVPGTTATPPEEDPINWIDLQPDNRWAMFDLTDNTTSSASGPMHFAIKSGLRCNSLFLGGVVGTDVQTVVAADGVDDYSNQQNLRLRKTTGWYSYFFGGFAYRKAVALLDLPPLTTATVSVSIINTGAGGTACAAVVLGKNVFIGLAEYNAQRKARNFSTVTRDEFGKATLVKRRSIPTTQQTLFIAKELADTILEMNELLNATPAAWLGLDEPTDGYFNALQIVGVYQEFDIDVSYPNHARVNLKLEEI